MWSKILARFKRKQAETNYENVVCANCEAQFTGRFCSDCGQAVKDYDKPFSFVFYNFMGDILLSTLVFSNVYILAF